jgi:hypothetical protein
VPHAKIPALSLSFFLAASLCHAAVDYRAKSEATALYRAETLEPPPLAALAKGERVTLMVRGADRSLVKTEGGIKGWVRNADLEGVRAASEGRHDLKDVDVTADGVVGVLYYFGEAPTNPDLLPIDRSFTGEIIETADREQTEMRHDEN